MKFNDPILLNLLWLLFALAGVMVYGIMKRKKILLGFARSSMLSSLIPGFNPRRPWIKAILILIASAFAIVAMAGPQWGFHWEKVEQKGVDIMIALDCSKSMLAQDIKPNRLERAKREIIDLLRMMKSDRAGLVAFSGQAILQCPLTLDHQAFNIFLNVLEPGFLPAGGTNLGAAVQSCINGFEKDSDTQKAIILITDGENTTGDVDKVLQEAVKLEIKIFCIGVGDLQGAPIPDENGGFKKDRSGNIVLSKVDEDRLEKIAAMTSGVYVRSVAGDMDLDLIYSDRIQGGMEKKTLVSGKRKIWENRYQWFLFPCLVLLIIEFWLPCVSSKKALFLVAAGLVIVLQAPSVQAESVSASVQKGMEAFEKQDYEKAQKHFIDAQLEDPDDERLYYNIGTAAYMARDFEQARRNFSQAIKSENVDLRHKALYNLANTQYQLGQLDDAIQNYETLLKEFPDDVEAKENLAFVRQKKEEQKQNQGQGKDQKNNHQDQQNQNQDQDQQKKDKTEQYQGQDRNSDQKSGQNQNPDQKNEPDKTQQPDGQKNQKAQTNDSSKDPLENSLNTPENEGQAPGASENKEDEKEQMQGQEAAAAQESDKKKTPSEMQQMQKMLNRLEDIPGRAMIPVGKRTENDKDW